MRAILVVSVLLVLARAGVVHADEPRSPGETNEGAIELCTQQPGSDGCTRWVYYCMLRPSHPVCTALGVAGILATDPDKAQMVVNFFNDMESVNEQSFQDTFYTGCNTYRLNGTSGEEHVDDFCGFYASWCAVNFRPTSRSVKLCDMLVAGDRRPEPPVYQAASERGVTTNGTTNIYDSNYVPPGVVHVVRDTGPPFDFSPSPRERHRRVLRVWGGPSFSNVNGARSNGDGEFDVELLPRTGDNNFGNRSRRSCELTANSQMLG